MVYSYSGETSRQSAIEVLYVSSTPSVRESRMFSSDRISVRVRSDSETALEAIDAEIDCVVGSHEPPAIDARRLLDRLRDAGHDQPFILYGPEIRSGVVETILANGGDYLCSVSDTQARTVLATRIRRAVEADRTRARLDLKSRAMDQARVGITITDPESEDNPIVYANDRFEDITGYERSDVIGRNCRLLQGAGTDERAVERIRTAIEDRDPVSVELLNYRADGTPFWNQLDIAPVREDGEVTHFFGFQKDVTERKTLEEDLRRQTELQERFASVVSHDLRNPLTLAQGNLELARDERDDPRLDEVADALDRMEELIDDVLEMARHGTTISDPRSIDLASVTARARDIVDVSVELVDDLPTVRGEPERVCTLFENLFRNAVEHASMSPASQAQRDTGRRSASSEPSVAAAPEDSVEHGSTSSRRGSRADDAVEHGSPPADGRDDPAGDDVRIRIGTTDEGFYVEDDGPGIPEAERATVFDWGTTTTDHGTGYGLALVRTIARAHGWDVTVTEGTTGGARFEFQIGARPEAGASPSQ